MQHDEQAYQDLQTDSRQNFRSPGLQEIYMFSSLLRSYVQLFCIWIPLISYTVHVDHDDDLSLMLGKAESNARYFEDH